MLFDKEYRKVGGGGKFAARRKDMAKTVEKGLWNLTPMEKAGLKVQLLDKEEIEDQAEKTHLLPGGHPLGHGRRLGSGRIGYPSFPCFEGETVLFVKEYRKVGGGRKFAARRENMAKTVEKDLWNLTPEEGMREMYYAYEKKGVGKWC